MRIEPSLRATLIALLVAGCASSRPAGMPVRPIEHATTVEVSNQNWADVTVYAVAAGIRHRLGSVTTMQTTLFRVPTHTLSGGELQLLIDLIGSRQTYLTQPVLVHPGGRAVLRVENHLAISSLAVWNR